VAFANKFVVQGTTDAGLTGAQFLGALGTGLVKNTTSTGVLSIAVAGTDYQAPLTNPVTGTGIAGYLTEWSSTSATDSTFIYHVGDEFGVNTITDQGDYEWQVKGGGWFGDSTYIAKTLIIPSPSTGSCEALKFKNTLGNSHSGISAYSQDESNSILLVGSNLYLSGGLARYDLTEAGSYIVMEGGDMYWGTVTSAGVDNASMLINLDGSLTVYKRATFSDKITVADSVNAENGYFSAHLGVGAKPGLWDFYSTGQNKMDSILYVFTKEAGKENNRIEINPSNGDLMRIRATDLSGMLPLYIGGNGDETGGLKINADASIMHLTVGGLKLGTINHATTDLDKFLVNHGDTVKYRTGAELLSDLGATTVGGNFLQLTNPSAITFPRINADNTVTALSAADFRTAIGAGGGDAITTNPLSQFAATTSAQLAGVLSDEVGTDKVVYNTNPTLVGFTATGNGLFNDNIQGIWGTGSDLKIYHDGTANQIQSIASDLLIGNSSTTSEFMRLYYNGGSGYVSLRYDGSEVFTTTSTGVNLASGKNYYLNGSKYNLDAATAGTTKATWDADDVLGVTRAAISGYVAANNAGSIQYAKVTISNADLKNAYESPFPIVADPGNGYAIKIDYALSAIRINYVSSALTDTNIEFYINGVADYKLNQQGISGSVNATSTKLMEITPGFGGPSLIESEPLLMRPDDDIITGDGSIDVYIAYRIITL
jgi:hypothetical protein